MNMLQTEQESMMEAILFASGEPIAVEQICKGTGMTRQEVDDIMSTIIDRYAFENRGIRILKLNTSYQMCSAPEFSNTIREILESRPATKLSQPAIEVLAVIAYHQPTTRAYVDQIRGVDSAYTVSLLLERGLIEESGRLNVPGRPILYRTTRVFLRSFDLEDLSELPDLALPEPDGNQISMEGQLKQQEDETMEQVRFL